MFNLFKSERQVIQEIHDEFDTAEDRLLQQADSLLKELNIPTQTSIEVKADKLISLGFVNSEVVVKSKGLKETAAKIKTKIVGTREQAELIRYYKQNYPFQKFLTEQELERICEKYNLIFAPVSNYIKDVPEKNINEISAAPVLKNNDIVPIGFIVTDISFYGNHTKEYKDYIREKINGLIFTESGVTEGTIRKLAQGFTGVRGDSWYFSSAKMEKTNKEGLFIAAPISHFDLKGLSKKGKHGFMQVFKIEIKDPIVFRYVRGGVQVLSKWGLEGQDELLVNEINN